MTVQRFYEAALFQIADGTAIANSTTETIVFPNITLPSNLMQDSRYVKLVAMGRYSTTGTPTLVFAARYGGVAGTVLAQSTTITGGSTITNAIWKVELWIQTTVNGSAGSLFAMGEAALGSGLTTPAVGSATAAPGFSFMGSAASQITPAAVGSLDLTTDTSLSLTAKWSAASSSNTLTGHRYYFDIPN